MDTSDEETRRNIHLAEVSLASNVYPSRPLPPRGPPWTQLARRGQTVTAQLLWRPRNWLCASWRTPCVNPSLRRDARGER